MQTPRHLTAFVVGLTATAIALCTAVFVATGLPTRAEVPVVAVFTFLGAVSYALSFDRDTRTSSSMALLPFTSLAALLPNTGALAGYAVVAGMGELVSERGSIKRLFNFAQQLVGYSLGLLLYRAAGGEPSLTALPKLLPFVVLMETTTISNIVWVSMVMYLADGTPFRHSFVRHLRRTLALDLIQGPVAYLFAFALLRFGPLWSSLLLGPLLAVRQQVKNQADLEATHQELLQLMVASIEARDPYTSGHSRRVARYAQLIAGMAGHSAREIERTAKAALLHDIGKIHEEFAPILRHQRRLTDEERLVMQTHSQKGAALVGTISALRPIIPAIRGHHEAWDGNGYPDGLVGAAIPVGARIISIADTIDAMTTDRPYRKALEPDHVAAEIERMSARQFDPTLTALVLTPPNWYRLVTAIHDERALGPTRLSDRPIGEIVHG